MVRHPVSSSNLSSVGYDERTEILEIAFHSGSVYQYFNVPAVVYQSLMTAASKGSYHYYNIRNHYRYQRIS